MSNGKGRCQAVVENATPLVKDKTEFKKDNGEKVYHLYAGMTVPELRDLVAIRRVSLKKGYVGKSELVKLACSTHPAELDAVAEFQSAMLQNGFEVRWRSRWLATKTDTDEMVQFLTEQVDILRRALAWPAWSS